MSTQHSALVEAGQRLTPQICGELVQAIESAGGIEVFAIGSLDEAGLVREVEIVARGTIDTVPALGPYFEKGSVLIHNHPSGYLQPSEADVAIAADAGTYGVGSYIVNNAVSELYIVAEPARRKSYRMLDEEGLSGALDQGGKLSQKMPAFEPRASQIAMTSDVASLFNQGGILAAEAGTGVGKSFAYLVPAMAWAQGNEERVVISTATINLQDQLFSKDIPLVASIFKKKLKAVLVKGRSNYVCKRRLGEAIEEEGLLLDDESPLKRILAWDESGGSGDRADLPFRVEDQVWNKVCSEADACISIRCPSRERCHVISVRKNAADAQIIVVNHHLLFADLASRQRGSGLEQTSILPAYSSLILDEAHSIEASATSLFTESFTRFSVVKKLSRLWRKNRTGQFGALAKLSVIPAIGKSLLKSFEPAVKEIQGSMSDLEAATIRLLSTETTLRLREKNQEIVSSVCEPAGRLQRSILALTKIIADILETLPESRAQDPSAFEARIIARGLNELADLIARLKDFDANPDTIFWLEKSRTSQKDIFISFNATPLEVAAILERSVFEKVRTVVCTSATLSVGGSFDFWMKRIGISKQREDVETKHYPSPFPFSSNAILAVDSQAPEPAEGQGSFQKLRGRRRRPPPHGLQGAGLGPLHELRHPFGHLREGQARHGEGRHHLLQAGHGRPLSAPHHVQERHLVGPLRHRFLLGRRRRARGDAFDGRHHQAALQGSQRSHPAGPRRGRREARRQFLHGNQRARGHHQVQAGFRQAHPPLRRQGRGRRSRPTSRHGSIRPAFHRKSPEMQADHRWHRDDSPGSGAIPGRLTLFPCPISTALVQCEAMQGKSTS